MMHYNYAIRLHEGNTYELLIDVETTGEQLIGLDTMEQVQAYINENILTPYLPDNENTTP